MIFPRSLKAKLIVSYTLVVAFSFGIVTLFLDRNFEKDTLQETRTSLVRQGALCASRIEPLLQQKGGTAALDALVKELGAQISCRVTVVDVGGNVLTDSFRSLAEAAKMENHAGRPEMRAALGGATGEDTRYSSTLKMGMLYVAVPLKSDGRVTGAVRLALPLAGVTSMLTVIRRTMVCALLWALALACCIGFVLMRRVTGPLNSMIQVSRKFTQGDFSRRIHVTSNDELGELARALNGMAKAVEDKISQIQTQNQHLAAIFNSMIEGVIVVDKNARLVSINPTIEEIFGITKKDAEGRFLLEAIRNVQIAELVSQVLEDGNFVEQELHLEWPVQKVFQVYASAVFEKEAVQGCLVVIHDMTQVRLLETVRRDFLANAAHELKTPLTSIRGFVETLLEGALDDKAHSREFLGIIHDHTIRLDSLVSDLLSLSYLESKQVVLTKERVLLAELSRKVVSGFGAQMKKKSLTLASEVPPEMHVVVDRGMLEQVFTNLIDNAIKFNQDKGTIKIGVQESPDAITVTVEDNGPGIPAKDVARIFERFYRVDKARSRQMGGTGLGLSIVKHIVELHGGKAGVESTQGLGSKFWFTIPKGNIKA